MGISNEHIKLSITCPICQSKKEIQLPISIIKKSKKLTTVSIPRGMICNHHFQLFLDTNCVIRGFQKVDYELNKNTIQNQETQFHKRMSLDEIYEEFWEYIEDDNEQFQDFISKDKRRRENLNSREISQPNGNDLIPHVCKNLK
ncbi:MAG: hypothetical protein EU517_00080 [Promethearchaeota archaeon]|nr:MAG: hypothetical protein EU517_00080 [Candidatus Lokiarchaeota archaeon]